MSKQAVAATQQVAAGGGDPRAALQAQQRALLDEIAEYQPEIPDPEELAKQQRALLDEIAAALV